jgi:peptide/nickel transport system substrate-binding protein
MRRFPNEYAAGAERPFRSRFGIRGDVASGAAALNRLWAVAVLAATAAGCTRVGAGAGPPALHAWTTPDTLRIGFYEEPDSLDPVVTTMAFAGDVFALEFDGLIRYDERGRPVPDLARDVPTLANGGISRDGRTLTYHLMPAARWHDGVPVTADDVIYTWRQIMNPGNVTPSRTGYDRIASIDAPDSHTVRLHFRAPYPPALYLFRDGSVGAIVPKHVLFHETTLNHAAFNARPIGSGPYIFRSWSRGSDMRFDANPAYFRGAPKIPHVVLKFVADQNTLLAALRAHEIDLYYSVPAAQFEQVRGLPGIRVRAGSTLHWEHLAFNVRRPPLDERSVRLALCYGLDEAALFKKIYRGLGRPAPTHFNPDFGWGDPAVGYYPYDPPKARALLEAAGWHLTPDGVRRKDGKRLTFALSTVAGVKQREACEVVLQNQWRALGADVIVKNYPAATLFAPSGAGGMLFGGKTDVSLFTWENTTPDPDDENYISPDRIPPAGQNVMAYRNPEIGRLVRAGLATFDVPTRKRVYARTQRILMHDVPEYVLDWLPEITAANDDLQGPGPVPVGSDLWNIANWTFRPGARGP